ncbi:MAG: branched-chain amino acid aminotransferase [Christensenellales bacterium]
MKITRTANPKQKPQDESKLGFGRLFTDHMFLMRAENGVWDEGEILPYGPLSIDPASTVLHYGQEVFEGMKAYKAIDGRTLLFRPRDNFERMNISAARLCMPALDVDYALSCLTELVKLDEDWIPKTPGTSLYIRPNMFGNDAKLGVSSANNVVFNIILSPSGAYYAGGLAPTKIFVEPEYVRAVRGGIGFTKAGGNYAASMLAGFEAHKMGYDQVLWLDGVERKYVEEVGAMNMFFLFKDELVTPALQGSILAGITRRSVLQLAQDAGINAVERRISIDEVVDGIKSGRLLEAFGSGTAAVISPVGELRYRDERLVIGDGGIGEVSQMLYDTLTGIQYGRLEDRYGWTYEVK